MTYGGYSWDYKTNMVIGGAWISKTSYKTYTTALDACYANANCKGVSYYPENGKFWLNAKTKEKTHPGGMFWRKKGKSYTYSGRVWSMYSGYQIKGGKSSTKKYTE